MTTSVKDVQVLITFCNAILLRNASSSTIRVGICNCIHAQASALLYFVFREPTKQTSINCRSMLWTEYSEQDYLLWTWYAQFSLYVTDYESVGRYLTDRDIIQIGHPIPPIPPIPFTSIDHQYSYNVNFRVDLTSIDFEMLSMTWLSIIWKNMIWHSD